MMTPQLRKRIRQMRERSRNWQSAETSISLGVDELSKMRRRQAAIAHVAGKRYRLGNGGTETIPIGEALTIIVFLADSVDGVPKPEENLGLAGLRSWYAVYKRMRSADESLPEVDSNDPDAKDPRGTVEAMAGMTSASPMYMNTRSSSRGIKRLAVPASEKGEAGIPIAEFIPMVNLVLMSSNELEELAIPGDVSADEFRLQWRVVGRIILELTEGTEEEHRSFDDFVAEMSGSFASSNSYELSLNRRRRLSMASGKAKRVSSGSGKGLEAFSPDLTERAKRIFGV